VNTIIGTDIVHAAQLIKSGEVVAIPTETVYGLAANGINEHAIEKIFEAKGRPLSNPLILHFPNNQSITPYIVDFPVQLKKLASKFWPGPLTLLLNKSNLVPNIITAGHDRVAVRVPSHKLTLELLNHLNFPLAAPSANLYGNISPTKSEHVFNQLNEKISYILEGGACNKGLESTIVGMQDEKIIVYRLGSISLEEIEEEIEQKALIQISSDESPLTSGMVKHHYAPSTPLYFINSDTTLYESDSSGFIFFQNDFLNVEHKFILSENGNLNEAAHKLYDALHLMDSKKFKRIFIEHFPENQLGRTINDRLKRATSKFIK
jgi:L-threonylcarbamoyladenylate synthase